MTSKLSLEIDEEDEDEEYSTTRDDEVVTTDSPKYFVRTASVQFLKTVATIMVPPFVVRQNHDEARKQFLSARISKHAIQVFV
ncbi:hypothetical protein GOP47_0021499 [Adiantum capillus-veneris]|uniref:Uncharacterized protein n=1 Tax=Adiantum capillus-veneris TaxID=13818 RepID=A0A9D4U8H6_ADICA|nr:hypothetical protein GOP47_0021499 [Adiantum capillus-veneris]